jgi:hypothetical protein
MTAFFCTLAGNRTRLRKQTKTIYKWRSHPAWKAAFRVSEIKKGPVS